MTDGVPFVSPDTANRLRHMRAGEAGAYLDRLQNRLLAGRDDDDLEQTPGERRAALMAAFLGVWYCYGGGSRVGGVMARHFCEGRYNFAGATDG